MTKKQRILMGIVFVVPILILLLCGITEGAIFGAWTFVCIMALCFLSSKTPSEEKTEKINIDEESVEEEKIDLREIIK